MSSVLCLVSSCDVVLSIFRLSHGCTYILEPTGYIHNILDIIGYLDIMFFEKAQLRGKRKEGDARIY